MRHADKNRNPHKARKRAKNDARTALRKLAEWASESGDATSAALAARALEDVDTITRRLTLTVEPSGSRDVWEVKRDGSTIGNVEPHASEKDAIDDARATFGRNLG